MKPRRLAERALLIVVAAGVCVAFVATRAQRLDSIAARIGASLSHLDRADTASRASREGDGLMVLVRNIEGLATATTPAFHMEPWHIHPMRVATTAEATTVALLVDRVLLDVRSYRPVGEDYQVALHCTLVDLTTRRAILDFTTRGPQPGRRDGLLSVFGLLRRRGSEPWPEVSQQVASWYGRK
jgi:hypothetical protein